MIISRAEIATSRPIGSRAFSLIEILIATAVLTIILLLTSKILGHATAISRTSNKRIDTDTDARLVLDRIAVDIAKMLSGLILTTSLSSPGGPITRATLQGIVRAKGTKLPPDKN